jgi:hypothetical protein
LPISRRFGRGATDACGLWKKLAQISDHAGDPTTDGSFAEAQAPWAMAHSIQFCAFLTRIRLKTEGNIVTLSNLNSWKLDGGACRRESSVSISICVQVPPRNQICAQAPLRNRIFIQAP